MEAGGGWRVSNKMESISNYGTHIHRVLHTRQVRKQPPLCHWLTGGPSPPPIPHSPSPRGTTLHLTHAHVPIPAQLKSNPNFFCISTREAPFPTFLLRLFASVYINGVYSPHTHTHTDTHKFTCTTIYLYCSLLFLAKMTTHK